jgi:hypothetical protein
MELTAEEKAIGNKAISKFEKGAKNWRRNLLILLIVGLLAFAVGSRSVIEGLNVGVESMEDSIQRYVDEAEQLPSGTERDLWMVGTFRKAAIILEQRFVMYKYAVESIAFGLIAEFTGLAAIMIVVVQWRKKPQRLLLAKLLRAKWEEEIAKS